MNKLAHLSALQQKNAPFKKLALAQQDEIERARNLANSAKSEMGNIGFSLCCQVELANRLADIVEDLDGSQVELARDLAHGLHSTLMLLNNHAEHVTSYLDRINDHLPDFGGERMTEFWLEQEQGGGTDE